MAASRAEGSWLHQLRAGGTIWDYSWTNSISAFHSSVLDICNEPTGCSPGSSRGIVFKEHLSVKDTVLHRQ